MVITSFMTDFVVGLLTKSDILF